MAVNVFPRLLSNLTRCPPQNSSKNREGRAPNSQRFVLGDELLVHLIVRPTTVVGCERPLLSVSFLIPK